MHTCKNVWMNILDTSCGCDAKKKEFTIIKILSSSRNRVVNKFVFINAGRNVAVQQLNETFSFYVQV